MALFLPPFPQPLYQLFPRRSPLLCTRQPSAQGGVRVSDFPGSPYHAARGICMASQWLLKPLPTSQGTGSCLWLLWGVPGLGLNPVGLPSTLKSSI